MANIGNASLDDAQRKLVEENINLVYHMAHKRGIYDEDLIQEGMIGLMNAARYFSPEFGVKFVTYAGSYIWAALFGTYSHKKYIKNSAVTCSLDDPDINLQPRSFDECGCFVHLSSSADEMADDIIQKICEGFNKKEVCLLLDLTKPDKNGELVPNTSKLNAILHKVGRDLYADRGTKKKVR